MKLILKGSELYGKLLGRVLASAKKILESDKFSEGFLQLVRDVDEVALYNHIHNATYNMHVGCHIIGDNGAIYSGIYPHIAGCEKTAYLCSVLVNQAEVGNDQGIDTGFLTVKVVNAISRLILFDTSKDFNTTRYGQITTPPQKINGVQFTDFGSMIESVIFGGVSCIRSWIEQKELSLDQWVVFPRECSTDHLQTGKIVTDLSSLTVSRPATYKLTLGGVYNKPTYIPGIPGMGASTMKRGRTKNNNKVVEVEKSAKHRASTTSIRVRHFPVQTDSVTGTAN